jgi:hypothetical protein
MEVSYLDDNKHSKFQGFPELPRLRVYLSIPMLPIVIVQDLQFPQRLTKKFNNPGTMAEKIPQDSFALFRRAPVKSPTGLTREENLHGAFEVPVGVPKPFAKKEIKEPHGLGDLRLSSHVEKLFNLLVLDAAEVAELVGSEHATENLDLEVAVAEPVLVGVVDPVSFNLLLSEISLVAVEEAELIHLSEDFIHVSKSLDD